MSIQIEGLNKKQRMLADIIWALDTQDQLSAGIEEDCKANCH